MLDIIISVLAHLCLISIGISSFLLIANKLTTEIAEPPIKQLFWIFGIYGGLVLLILHLLTWQYSGMALLGLLAVAGIAPIAGFTVSYSLIQSRRKSRRHQLVFILGLLYTPVAVSLLTAMFFLIKEFEGDI